MNPLSVQAISPATLSAMSALRPVQALANQGATGSTLSVQDLGQNLFRQSLQAAAQSVIEPSAGASLAQEITSSLLASLTAPQATVDTTATADATTNPATVQAANASASTSPSATASTVTALADLPAAQDAFATSSSADFALQTAARFGAGVVAQAVATPEAVDLNAGLIRDAAAVQRLGNLQPHAGSPGPEAFAQPQPPVPRALRGYETVPATQAIGAGTIDLLA